MHLLYELEKGIGWYQQVELAQYTQIKKRNI